MYYTLYSIYFIYYTILVYYDYFTTEDDILLQISFLQQAR